MEKYQLTFITGNEKFNSEKKFKVYDDQSEALGALSLYSETKKQKDRIRSCVVELTKVDFQDGKPCGAKFVTRKYVEEKEIIAEAKTKVKTKAKVKVKVEE